MYIASGAFGTLSFCLEVLGAYPTRKEPIAHSLRLQIAQSRPHLHILGPRVGMIYILGALSEFGLGDCTASSGTLTTGC